MGIELRMPNITSASEREQLAQIKSYLYQIIPKLQWALNNVNATGVSEKAVEQIARSISTSNPASGGGAPVNAEITFDKLKPLIIKSAEIVEAYYEEINKKLEGIYVAESDFGTFKEKTEQKISQTSSYVDQRLSNVQVLITEEVDAQTEEIDSTLGIVENLALGLNDVVSEMEKTITETNSKVAETSGAVDEIKATAKDTSESVDKLNSHITDVNRDIADLKVAVMETKGYIRSGQLNDLDSPIPLYGVEVGQTTTVDGAEVFNKYARFTADRLSFYNSSGYEIAYISGFKLYITDAEFTGAVTFGAFCLDTKRGFNLKWMGRG